VSEVDRPGYPATGSGSPSAGPPTVEYPVSIARTDRSGRWEPPPKRHPPRMLTTLLVTFVSVIGVVRIAWPAATTAPPWPSSSASSPWASPRAALPVTSGASSGALDLSALAAGVDPAVVDINTQLGDSNGRGAGTGIVLSPSGEVLTNNHVIDGATSISATDVGNGQAYPATVVGYDRSHDLAVLQLQGASGLQTASIGDSSAVAVGDEVAAIGNAGGRGGTPSVAAGTVSALDQMVTVSDEITGSAQQLAGLIQVAADVQPGDSGGPLANASGEVIGIVTAGSGGTRGQPSGGDGMAIPINDAIAISKQIRTGTASVTVHIGATGILGV
jgi:S1-C subfamily serine protease